jgi:transcriptional antiterminator RfaH
MSEAGQATESGASALRDDRARWFVVQTLAHREVGARGQLGAQGFHAFLPQIAKTVRHARKLRNVRAPLFPGYLFVRLDLDRDRWRSVNGTFGVAAIVMAHDRPAPVPRGVVEILKDNADETGLVALDRGLDIGQRVQVVSGPFAESFGSLDRVDASERVRVLLDIMGGQIPVVLARGSLRAA